MKILHILPTLQRRGAQIFAAELWRALGSYGIEQSLVVLKPGLDEVGIDVNFGHVECLPVLHGLRRVKELHRLFESIRPDVILAHGGEPFKYAVLARGRKAKPKIIYRKIGLAEHWLGRHRWLKLPFQRWLTGRADAISTVGEAMKNETIDLFHATPDKTRVIYRGVDQARFSLSVGTRKATRSALGIAEETKVLITVSALAWEKNQVVMIRTLHALLGRFPNLLLLLVGNGPDHNKLEKAAEELGIAGSVRFLGLRSDVPNLLAAADIFLLSSLTEGVPGVLIEAGMAGMPCVTWDVAGAKEVVQNESTGLVTPYNDEERFIEAVAKLLADPPRATLMGEIAKSFCQERFNLDYCAKEHIRLFKDLL